MHSHVSWLWSTATP